jgi:hypothetical protein
MRRSGSSSCLLKPKSLKEDGESLTVTVLNTLKLPSYSTERFYMLSEIELKAHSTLFLCDLYDDCDQTQDTVETSSNQSQEDPETQTLFPPYCILYILWRPNMVSSVRAFTEVVIQDCIQKLKDASKNNSRIYLVVDTLVPSGPNADADADDASAERRYQAQLHVAETLARHVAQTLRTDLEGITVGVANHLRAAPGLEVVMEATAVGSNTRRRRRRRRQHHHENNHTSSSSSLVGILCSHPDDLLGLASTETDAAQGVLQSITCAEWGGYGDWKSFAHRSHTQWCDMNGVLEVDEPLHKKRGSRKYRAALENARIMDDPLVSFVFVVFLAWLYFYGWAHYRESIEDFCHRLADLLQKQRQ